MKKDALQYANCWEDADILLLALNVRTNGTYLSVSSAGDNTLSLLTQSPSMVVAVDISGAQLASLELRKAAFSRLSYEMLLQFLGIKNGIDRLEVYSGIRSEMSQDSKRYWDGHKADLMNGPIHSGKLERYFTLLRTYVLPLIHNRKRVLKLLTPKSEDDRRTYYHEQWNNSRWRMMFQLFLHRVPMRFVSPNPDLFKSKNCDFSKQMYLRAEHALSVLPVHANAYLEYILTGNYQQSLPFYLRHENYERIRKNLDKLVIFRGGVHSALKHYQRVVFDGFNLSNIFEDMSYDQYQKELQLILNSSGRGTRLVYWNQIVDRRCPEHLVDRLLPDRARALELFAQNQTFFYKALIIEEVLGGSRTSLPGDNPQSPAH
ncbi:MAG: DUF3419 family protein [Nitrospirota bacterium]